MSWSDVKVALDGMKICPISPRDANKIPDRFAYPYEFYYKRGNRYFFRSSTRKVIIETSDNIQLKRGEYIDIAER